MTVCTTYSKIKLQVSSVISFKQSYGSFLFQVISKSYSKSSLSSISSLSRNISVNFQMIYALLHNPQKVFPKESKSCISNE